MQNSPATPSPNRISIKVFGIGGAGCNLLNQVNSTHCPNLISVALNTDSQSLAGSLADEKFCLGTMITHGLGAGGDPEMGRAAAEANIEHLREFCAGTDVVIVLAGLGGGTGTAAISVVAQAAKHTGALVLGIVTTPFAFEGGRRQRQAQLGVQQLRSIADAVICFPNEKLFRLVNEKDTVRNAFEAANTFVADGVFGLARLLTQNGLINVDFADLRSVTRQINSESSFATAHATGENRLEQLLEKLFAHPMLEDEELLENSESLLVSITGGPDLTMAEVNGIMKGIGQRCQGVRVTVGAAIDEDFANRISVTLIASGRAPREAKSGNGTRSLTPSSVGSEGTSSFMDSSATPRPPSRMVAPAPELTAEKKDQMFSRQNGSRPKKNVPRMRQNELPLEIISKGRFERSEPTIHRGEDLDLPTYIRRGIAFN